MYARQHVEVIAVFNRHCRIVFKYQMGMDAKRILGFALSVSSSISSDCHANGPPRLVAA